MDSVCELNICSLDKSAIYTFLVQYVLICEPYSVYEYKCQLHPFIVSYKRYFNHFYIGTGDSNIFQEYGVDVKKAQC